MNMTDEQIEEWMENQRKEYAEGTLPGRTRVRGDCLRTLLNSRSQNSAAPPMHQKETINDDLEVGAGRCSAKAGPWLSSGFRSRT